MMKGPVGKFDLVDLVITFCTAFHGVRLPESPIQYINSAGRDIF